MAGIYKHAANIILFFENLAYLFFSDNFSYLPYSSHPIFEKPGIAPFCGMSCAFG